MPKATLEFDLDEDRCAFKITSDAMSWALVSWDMDQYLRGLVKYGTELDTKTLEAIREHLWDLINDHGVSLDDIE